MFPLLLLLKLLYHRICKIPTFKGDTQPNISELRAVSVKINCHLLVSLLLLLQLLVAQPNTCFWNNTPLYTSCWDWDRFEMHLFCQYRTYSNDRKAMVLSLWTCYRGSIFLQQKGQFDKQSYRLTSIGDAMGATGRFITGQLLSHGGGCCLGPTLQLRLAVHQNQRRTER